VECDSNELGTTIDLIHFAIFVAVCQTLFRLPFMKGETSPFPPEEINAK